MNNGAANAIKFLKCMEDHALDPEVVTADMQAWTPSFGGFSGETYLDCVRAVAALMKGRKLTFVVDGVTDGGDRVALEVSARAELPNGQPYQQIYHFLAEMKDGKVALWKEYTNTRYAVDVLFGAYFTKVITGQD